MSLFLSASTLLLTLAAADASPAAVQAVAAAYKGNVERVFNEQCADCHGRPPASLAGPALETAKKKSAKAHKKLDMDAGFPFKGRRPLPGMLDEVADEVEDGDMPPKKYLKEKGTTLSPADRKAVVEWARGGATQLAPPAN